jgi:hypothetical protein
LVTGYRIGTTRVGNLVAHKIEAKYVMDTQTDFDLEDSQRPLSAGKPPLKVKAADRLKDDIDVLLTLTEDEMPPLRRIRTRRVGPILYCFGDASGESIL